ncbi:hypothetical protein [Ferruginibacter sp.]
MKKLIIIAIAVFSISAASAQNRNDRFNKQDDRYQAVQVKDDWSKSKDYSYDRNNDRERQEAYDRMNHDYDKRISDYRNDRSLNKFDRDRKIREAEMERQQKSKSFGKGLAVGAIAGILLGAILGH